jgi:hypothetical protein
VKDGVFVCKEREQGCPTIGDLVCDGNRGIAMIEVPLHLEIKKIYAKQHIIIYPINS